jgi:hypothetical protein
MSHNAEPIMVKSSDNNFVSRLWMKIISFPILICKLSEYKKLVEIAMVQVLGFVEDERTFSNLTFMKNRLRNRLTTHLDVCVCMFS